VIEEGALFSGGEIDDAGADDAWPGGQTKPVAERVRYRELHEENRPEVDGAQKWPPFTIARARPSAASFQCLGYFVWNVVGGTPAVGWRPATSLFLANTRSLKLIVERILPPTDQTNVEQPGTTDLPTDFD